MMDLPCSIRLCIADEDLADVNTCDEVRGGSGSISGEIISSGRSCVVFLTPVDVVTCVGFSCVRCGVSFKDMVFCPMPNAMTALSHILTSVKI
jgi:hypothetical protein